MTAKTRKQDTSYRLLQSITIPAGIILSRAADQRGGKSHVESTVGFGKGFTGDFVVQVHEDAIASGFFEEVN